MAFIANFVSVNDVLIAISKRPRNVFDEITIEEMEFESKEDMDDWEKENFEQLFISTAEDQQIGLAILLTEIADFVKEELNVECDLFYDS